MPFIIYYHDYLGLQYRLLPLLHESCLIFVIWLYAAALFPPGPFHSHYIYFCFVTITIAMNLSNLQ